MKVGSGGLHQPVRRAHRHTRCRSRNHTAVDDAPSLLAIPAPGLPTNPSSTAFASTTRARAASTASISSPGGNAHGRACDNTANRSSTPTTLPHGYDIFPRQHTETTTTVHN